MTTKVLILLLLSLVSVTCYAEQGIYRKSDGSYAGSWRGNNMEREYLGPDGDYVGSAERDGSGWTFRNDEGDYAGSSSGPSDRNPFVGSEED